MTESMPPLFSQLKYAGAKGLAVELERHASKRRMLSGAVASDAHINQRGGKYEVRKLKQRE